MSHKSGGVIISSMLSYQGGQPMACLTPQECGDLQDIRNRDEYTLADRLRLAHIVATHADDPAD